MRLDILLLAAYGPLPYLALGLAWFRPGPNTSSAPILWAPIMGCGLAGFYAELAMLLALPVNAAVAAATVVSLGVAIRRWRHHLSDLQDLGRVFFPLYAFALFAAAVSPFPILGTWSGDWLILYDMGRGVVERSLDASQLSRPPLFGAASSPLWLFRGGLPPFQLMSVVVSAATVTTLFGLLRKWRPTASLSYLVPFLLSPVFLHHNAAAWGKLMTAGLLIAGVVEASEQHLWRGAVLFALAVGTHDAGIIFAPAWVWAALRREDRRKSLVRALIVLAVAGILLVLPIQIWEIAKFGLHAKLAANPVVSDRDTVPWGTKVLLAIVSSFVAWSPFQALWRWIHSPHPLAKVTLVKESFWFLDAWVSPAAGTVLGLQFPFLREKIWRQTGVDRTSRRAWIAVSAFAVFAASALTPYYSTFGTANAGLVPLQLGLYVLAVRLLPEDERARAIALRRASMWMIVLGTIPWLLFNLSVNLGLHLSPSFTRSFAEGSEGDYQRLLKNHLESLGLVATPLLPLCAALGICAWIWIQRKATVSRPPFGSTSSWPVAPAEPRPPASGTRAP